MQAGRIQTLKVTRKTDLGYMLTDGKDEVLLHFKEASQNLEVNQEVVAFLYFDKKGRLTATTNEVSVTLDTPGFAEVVEIISNLGVFVSINTPKDVLISKDYLPYKHEAWPNVGDKILICLKQKRDSLVAKPLNKYEIDELDSETKYEIGQTVSAIAYRFGEEGINLVTLDKVNVFVHKSMIRDKYHLGQLVDVKIVHKGKQGYNGSLTGNKENMIDPDKELIIRYLKANGGKLRLDAKSSSEEIEGLLHISRKAFKRALGGLYKDRLVEFENGFTILLEK